MICQRHAVLADGLAPVMVLIDPFMAATMHLQPGFEH
jgi:hypothetical protein